MIKRILLFMIPDLLFKITVSVHIFWKNRPIRQVTPFD